MRKLLLMAALVLSGCNRPTTTEAAASSSFGSNDPIVATAAPLPVGRYTIIHSPQVERDVILLDTTTGDTWSRVEDRNGEPGWELMPRLGAKNSN